MRRAATVMAAIGAVVLAGCAGEEGDDPTKRGSEPRVTLTTLSPGPEVDNVFDFTAATVDGGTFDGLSLDDTDVILWFWAPWCPTCIAEAPVIMDAASRLPEGIEIVGMAGLSGDQEYMQEFVDLTGTGSLTHVADLDGSLWRRFDIATQATIVVIDDSGDAYTLHAGTTADELVDYAEKIAAA